MVTRVDLAATDVFAPLLVISSCTGEKSVAHPDQLTWEDFKSQERQARKEGLLAALAKRAVDLYTGDQHEQLMAGVSILQGRYGPEAVHLRIVSAGYGLVEENQKLLPYECTFNDMSPREAREWADQLGVARAMSEVAARFPLVIFLLGARYLKAIGPLPRPLAGQRFVFLVGKQDAEKLGGPGVIVVPSGVEQTREYGMGLVGLKGRMFRVFAAAVAEDAQLVAALMRDDSPETFQRALKTGKALV